MIKNTNKGLFLNGLISGIGWSFGVTIGFVIISTLLVLLHKPLNGVPIIGGFIANIVEETQLQLEKRSIVLPNE